MITVDPKALWKGLLTTLLTVVMGLLGWLASVAWDQQVTNTKKIQGLEQEKAVHEAHFEAFQRDHEALARRLYRLERERSTRQSPMLKGGK